MNYKVLKCFGLWLCLCVSVFGLSEPVQRIAALPSDIYLTGGEALSLSLPAPFSVSAPAAPAGSNTAERLSDKTLAMRVKLFDVFTLKRIAVHQRERVTLMPGGQSIGVAMYLPGALTVGTASFTAVNGETASPAQQAGIKPGDIILRVNGEPVKGASHLAALCAQGGALSLDIRRGEEEFSTSAVPVQDQENGLYKLGAWVRDSTAGIGTISFYDAQSLRYGALGHPVTDVDTGSILSIDNGEIFDARVIGISYGMQGTPGELHGAFGSANGKIGVLEDNTPYGIFGTLYAPLTHPLYPQGLPLAYADEVEAGDALILSTVDETGVRAFRCRITKRFPQNGVAGKSMIVEITDEALLSTTGGIVQGMSGSPVIQNGKLAGVVTHVFVNAPARGYAVYAQWMYEAALSR